jgi:hypothetical protein
MANSYKSKRTYAAAPDVVFDALRTLVQSKDLSVNFEDHELGIIEATTGVSFKSWGERLYITVSAHPAAAGSVVEIDSRSRMALIDWGRNEDNVDSFLDELNRTVS